MLLLLQFSFYKTALVVLIVVISIFRITSLCHFNRLKCAQVFAIVTCVYGILKPVLQLSLPKISFAGLSALVNFNSCPWWMHSTDMLEFKTPCGNALWKKLRTLNLFIAPPMPPLNLPVPYLRWLFTPRVLKFISLRHNMAIQIFCEIAYIGRLSIISS